MEVDGKSQDEDSREECYQFVVDPGCRIQRPIVLFYHTAAGQRLDRQDCQKNVNEQTTHCHCSPSTTLLPPLILKNVTIVYGITSQTPTESRAQTSSIDDSYKNFKT